MGKRIKLRDMRFINCLGRYLHSAFNFYADEHSQDDILFFLRDFELLYHPVDPAKNQKRYQNDNPWLFQPVTFFQDGKHISEVAWSDACYEFLSTKFNVQVVENPEPTPEAFESVLSDLLDRNGFVMLGIDDFHNDVKRQFYLKQHCRHSIVVDAIDTSSNEVSVIDDDDFYLHEYSLSIATLKRMYFSDSAFKELLTFSSSGFRNGLNPDDILRSTGLAPGVAPYSDGLMGMYEQLDDQFLEYVLRGINFSISSKIIPHVTFRRRMAKRAQLAFCISPEEANLLQRIINCWWEISRANKDVLESGRNLVDSKAQIAIVSEKLRWISEAEDRLSHIPTC